jgi:FAD/FMN-containing dehydrogenase
MFKKKDLIEIVGADNVSDAPEDLAKYSEDESFVHTIMPRCVVKPGNADEVQKLINWANETLTPLVPVSSGSPHFRGDTVPSTGGTVIVDLSRMNKIVRIDTAHRIVMVEPGVTFSELISAVGKEGLRLNLPLLPRTSKSVVGSLLEREPVIMPRYHWDIADPLACTEVIYGSGDMFRTGSAAGPGSLKEQWETGAAQNEAAGPIQADFYRLIQGAQGTMGIVVWATVRCERAPSIEEPFLVGSSKLDDLLEFIYWLIRRRLVDDCLVLNNSNLARIIAKEWPQEYKSIKDTLPPWILFFTITGPKYFPEEKVNYQTKAMTDIAKSLKIKPLKAIGKASASKILETLHKPSEEPYWKLRDKGSCYDIFFITVYDKLSELVSIMNSIAEKFDYPLSNIGVYIQPIVQGVNFHCEFNLFFDPNNPVEKDKIEKLSEAASNALSTGGAFFSRPYSHWADMAYRRDAETTIALRKVKKIFDPNNIMNPGKLCF